MKTLYPETIYQIFHAQCRSADMWINQWKHLDAAVPDTVHASVKAPQLRNVSLAIGKVLGIYNAMLVMHGDTNIPEDIIAKVAKYDQIWAAL